MTDHDERHGAKQPHRFNPAHAAVLDDEARFATLPPRQVIDLLAAPPAALVVDFGTGTGTYAIEIARARPDTKVIALDEQEPMLELLRAKLATRPLPNVEPLLARTRAAQELAGRADRILALNVLHELGDAALAELAALLSPRGQALFIDWNGAIDRAVGPPRDHLYTPDQAVARLTSAGFAIDPLPPFPDHFVLRSHPGNR